MKKGLYKVMVIIDTEEDAQDEVKNIIEGGATAQEATAKATAGRDKFNSTIMELLGGLTPQDQPGPTSLKATGDKLTIDMTPPALKPGAPGEGAVSPALPAPAAATPEAAGLKLTDLVNFS